MNSETKVSLLALANAAMREKSYTKAISLYKTAAQENSSLSEHVNFNIALAENRLEIQSRPVLAPVVIADSKSPAPALTNVSYSLVDTGKPTKSGLRGNIDVVDENFVHGWIYDNESPEIDLGLDLYADGVKLASAKTNIIRNDVKDAGGPKAECGFRLEHGQYTNLTGASVLTVFVAGTDELAFSQSIEINLLSAQIASLSKLAKIVKHELAMHSDPSMLWLSSTVIPKIMENTRKGEVEKSPSNHDRVNYAAQPRPAGVSVIIPVYEGYQETLNCINSVLKAECKNAYQLIVVNDCSPNNKLTTKLRNHSQQHKYTLVENEKNLGFVGTVNRGIRIAADDDVILLNSDTLVPDGWLDQLLTAAYSDPIVGTVTPFSNNATICSYPNFCQDNILPIDHNVNSLNSMFQRLNTGKIIDLPTAHGFCVFIKRAVIDEIGVFDEQKWGKGYAEENDFSLRAEQYGWRNVFALDTFVQHLGSVSFSSNTEEFVRKNLKILNGFYPDYAARVSQFISNDPAREFRNIISREILEKKVSRLKTNPKSKGNFILFVSLTIGGGTQVATDDLSKRLKKESVHTLMLTSPKPDIWRLSYGGSTVYLDYTYPSENEKLINDLKNFGVWHVNYHNTIEFRKNVWDLPNQLDCEYDVTVHDYLSICPRVNLIGTSRTYCGEPAVSECNSCINENGAHESSLLQLIDFDLDINKWRDFYEERFSLARKVFVPSYDAAKRLNKYFHDVEITVRPHPEPIKNIVTKGPQKAEVVNVAFLGAIGAHKGYDYLRGCAKHALDNNLPIIFNVIGYTKNDQEVSELSNIVLHGKYTREELPQLLRKSGCSVAAILSVWPETFSYTFSEALEQGLKIITFNMGAPVERMPAGCGDIVELEDNYESICLKIMEISTLPGVRITTGKVYNNYLSDYYGFDSGS